MVHHHRQGRSVIATLTKKVTWQEREVLIRVARERIADRERKRRAEQKAVAARRAAKKRAK